MKINIIEKIKTINNDKNKNEEIQQSFFTNKYTNIAKGVAILLMLFHHLGISPDLNVFRNPSLLYNISLQGKVCVSIFVILSGYGLNASFNKKFKGEKFGFEVIKFTFKHLLKLMINFWIIYAIMVLIGHFSGMRSINDVYGTNIAKNMIIDALGLANLFGTPTYNVTWWFMSLIILLYVCFPILKFILKRMPILLIAVLIHVWKFNSFEFYQSMNFYFPAFCLGMIFSQYYIFDKIKNSTKTKVEEIIASTIFLIFAIYARWHIGGAFEDIFLAITIICFCNSVVASLGEAIRNIFEFLGKHSSNIFMMHTFTYKYFFTNFFLSLKYWPIMYIGILVMSLLFSIIVELMKKLMNKYSKQVFLKFKTKRNDLK